MPEPHSYAPWAGHKTMRDKMPESYSDEDLPKIDSHEKFHFQCGPDQPCFNRCCADLTLPLTPYDVLRLRRGLGITSAGFLDTFTILRSWPDTGFPMPLLRMIEGPEMPCPFVTPAGCAVYRDRPGACRSWPLGRGAKIGREGVEETFYMVREDYCQGFSGKPEWTPGQWLENQGIGSYNKFNDRYMRLMAMVAAAGHPLDGRLGKMALLCFFQLDQFRGLIRKMSIFSRVELDEAMKARIMEDDLEGDEDCLNFALDWMELVIFGNAANLKRKDP